LNSRYNQTYEFGVKPIDKIDLSSY
jgi:hypothetical protein